MKDNNLQREITRKIFKDLGCTPFSIGKAGLTHSSLLVTEPVKISEDGLVKKAPTWYGEARGHEGIMCCLLVQLDNRPDFLDACAVLGFKNFNSGLIENSTRIGLRYDWSSEDDIGSISTKIGERWVSVSLAHRLQLAIGFETMVQEGVIWNPSEEVPSELRKDLSEIIAVDSGE